VSCTRTPCELLPPPSCLTSLILSLGPGVLVSRGRLALSPPLSARALLPRSALAWWATPYRPCYRLLGLQFAVGVNLSTGYSRFLYSLHFPKRLPSQTHTPLPIVSTVIGSTPPPPTQGLVLLLSYSYNPLTRLAPYYPFTLRHARDFLHGRTPQLPPVFVLHSLGGGCQHIVFSSNVGIPRNALAFFHLPSSPIVILWVSLVLIKILSFLLGPTARVFLLIPVYVFI